MYARIVTFRTVGVSHDEYVANATDIAAAFNDWPGLRSKLWLADEDRSVYGGIYLFDSGEDADRSRSEPQFLALHSLPTFADVRIEEFEILEAPSDVTAGLVRA